MPVANWQDDYCTGDARIDQEHQTLFALVNELDYGITTEASQAQLQSMLATMANHTIEHFQHEEALMQALQYPGYRRHKQTHDNLLAKVTALLEHFNQPDAVLSEDLAAFLVEWLSHHIKGEDQTMIRFMQDRATPNQTT